jgi:hypothetical protein
MCQQHTQRASIMCRSPTLEDPVSQYGGVVVLALAGGVCFVLSWTRSDDTPRFVGHAFVAAACLFAFFTGGPTWVFVAAGTLFAVNLAMLLMRVARA